MGIAITKLKDSIEEYLTKLEVSVRHQNALGHHDINIDSEQLYCDLLNEIFKNRYPKLKLLSANTPSDPNYKGIDLIDRQNRLFVQITSDATKAKILKTIEKVSDPQKYTGFTLWFVFIAGRSSEVDFRSIHNKVPSYITCKSTGVFYPSDLTKQLRGRKLDDYKRVYNLLQKHLDWRPETQSGIQTDEYRTKGALIISETPEKSDGPHGTEYTINAGECFSFINRIAMLCKFADHVRCMCEEYLEEPKGKKFFDDVLLQRINYQINNHIPDALPELGAIRQAWARNVEIYGGLLKINENVSAIDCAGRLDARDADVQEIKKLVNVLLTGIYDVIKAMCRVVSVSEDVAFTELSIKANEI